MCPSSTATRLVWAEMRRSAGMIALAVIAFIVGIPVFFEVGFVLLVMGVYYGYSGLLAVGALEPPQLEQLLGEAVDGEFAVADEDLFDNPGLRTLDLLGRRLRREIARLWVE